jgi:FKBP-type peptidyl-prolyl cis-trans isomerase
MQESKTKKSTRIIMLVIAIVMAGGFIGSYFLIIMNQNPTNTTQANQDATKGQNVDPTAYKVNGKVAKLEIVDEKAGTGAEVKVSDTVRVHYKGTFAQTGVKFDSSYDRGEPATFPLNGVIQAWQDGIPGMKVGGKRRLIVPSDQAYGPTGTTGIPPNSDLVFEVELLAINPAQ